MLHSSYEGTGRSLSLKLIQELRQQSTGKGSTGGCGYYSDANGYVMITLHLLSGRTLREAVLSDPIRYARGDAIEQWLHKLLCLDVATLPRVMTGCPPPPNCQLYLVCVWGCRVDYTCYTR